MEPTHSKLPELEPERRLPSSSLPSVIPPQPASIPTRKHLARAEGRIGRRIPALGVRTDLALQESSLVTRRQVSLAQRRRKRILIGVAVALLIFPPMWAVYLIGWLIWRSRPKQRSMRRVRRAIRNLKRDEQRVALQQLQDAHFIDPSNTDALYWMGLLLSRHDRQDEAADVLSLVAERIPGLPEVETALVEAYIATGESEAAIYHAQRLLDVKPHAPESLLVLADAFEAAGRLDLAIETLERTPTHKLTAQLLEAQYRLGSLYERQGNADRALHHFKRVYARDISYRDVQARVEAVERQLGDSPGPGTLGY